MEQSLTLRMNLKDVSNKKDGEELAASILIYIYMPIPMQMTARRTELLMTNARLWLNEKGKIIF